MKALLVFALVLLGVSVYAQQGRMEVGLSKVASDGFYRVHISSELLTALNPDLSNARIYNQAGKELPYILQIESPLYYTQQFKSYEVVDKKLIKNCCTSIILKNADSRPINNIHLSIRNAEVTKEASLLGSDDKENWFALKEHFSLTSINNPNNTSEVRIVDFPLSNYSYYQLQISDSASAPVNILNAGYYEATSEEGKYTEVPLNVARTDSANAKETYLHLSFTSPQAIDKLMLTMKGEPYFLRRASIRLKRESKTKKGKTLTYYETIYRFEISSRQPSVIELPDTRVRDLYIVIENDDNPSLDVSSLKAFNLNRYLTAWMKKDEVYTLKTGSKDMKAPVYDLTFFQDRIPEHPPIVSMTSVSIFKDESEKDSPTFFTNPLIIWAAIIVVILVLGFMAVRMINEANVKKQ